MWEGGVPGRRGQSLCRGGDSPCVGEGGVPV